jgi:Mg-chelatase subunit ChlI/Mg-chelatase subunit ChlD
MSLMPFSGFVDLEELKKTLLALAVDPGIGGLLILGPKGTGKSTLVRSFAELLPDIDVVVGCNFGCAPSSIEELCGDCSARLKSDGKLPSIIRKMSIVELPIGVTDDRVVGSIDVERTLKEGKINFEPGLLARAHRNILYIDEVNLLPDHIVDLILDAAAYGRNIVEREGVSIRHPARFILIGTMNPEEGELRPQLLDRFALSVPIITVLDPTLRAEIVKRNIEFETHHELFNSTWNSTQAKLRAQIEGARNHIREVHLPDLIIAVISHVCGRLAVDGYRPDIVAAKVARALAALDGRHEVTNDDAHHGLRLALAHRTRAGGLKPPATQGEIDKLFQEGKNLQIPQLEAQQSEEKGSSPQTPSHQQQKSSLRNAFNRLRPKREGDQPNDTNQHQRRGPSNFKILGYFFLAAMVVRMFFILQIWTFLMLLGFLMFIMFLISLIRRNKGGVSSDPKSGGAPKPRGGRATTMLAAFSWPTARKIHGKKIAEGEQLLEQALPEKSSGPKLELDKILTRARWLGRRKGQIGRGRPVSYRNFARGGSDISVSTSVRLAARRGRPFEVRREDLRVNVREGRIKASMILVLDSSESMIDSLSKVRDAIRAVRKGATRMRDRVGLIVFKGEEAHILQHPTTNFNLVIQKLGNVGLSDFTPLAAGMLRAVRMARTEQARGYAPLVLVASDGATNVSIPRWSTRMSDIPDPATDALHMAKIISVNKWKTLIANMAHVTHEGPADLVLGTHLMTRIAQVTKGIYVGFSHRNEEALVRDMSKEDSRPHLEKLIENV